MVADGLRRIGHDATHVRDYALQAAEDERIFALGKGENRILLSADTDFGTLLASARTACARSPQPLRTHAVAASATDCVYARVVAAPQATAEPLNLSFLVPATRARRLVRRVQVTAREVNAKAR
jgi:predicted nuclease of predicted toxin-antitoxin system